MSLDLSKDFTPQNDFFNYVNYNWIKKNPIPEDFQRWSIFNKLNDENKKKILDILNGLKELSDSSNEYKSLEILFNQGMNINTIEEKLPIDYIKEYYNLIKNSETKTDLLNVVFNLHLLNGINFPVLFGVHSDFDNSKINILFLVTSGLCLPDRDYYFDSDKIELVKKYKKFMKDYVHAFGLENDNFLFESVYEIEKQLAKVTLTKSQKRNLDLINNPTTYSILEEKYSSLPLKKLFDYLKINNKSEKKINVTNIKFLDTYQEMWDNLGLDKWKSYFIWTFILSISDYINQNIYKLKFDFYGTALTGTPKMLPRWKKVINICESNLGSLIGKLFVEKHFDKSSKVKALDIVKYIKEELKDRLKNNEWMISRTKKIALEKLSNMSIKIGYPEVYKDYNKLKLSKSNTFLQNILESSKFNEKIYLDKLYKLKDRNEWFMNAHTVNAYYSPSNNEIVFPAGILQEPFFSQESDAATNFGGIGCVIGHEITHGFDDQGRKFDQYGNKKNWWSEKDKKSYETITNKIKSQYSNYTLNGKKVNGELTLGENIADLGGVSISYHAFSKYLNDNKEENITINGFTPYQRFFINYATIWRSSSRNKEIEKRLKIDPHSPPNFRVNGVLTNFTEFYKSFNVLNGDKLWKPEKDRIKIW